MRPKQFAAGHEKKSPSITHPPAQLPAEGPSASPAVHVPVVPHQPQPASAPHSSQSVTGSQSGGIGSPVDPVTSSEPLLPDDPLLSVPGSDALDSLELPSGVLVEVGSADVEGPVEVSSVELAAPDDPSVPDSASSAAQAANRARTSARAGRQDRSIAVDVAGRAFRFKAGPLRTP